MIDAAYRICKTREPLLRWLAHENNEQILEDFTDVMHDSRGSAINETLYRPPIERNLAQFRYGPPVVRESVLLRINAPEILKWNQSDKNSWKTVGKDYQPWIVSGDPENKRGDFAVEKWVPYGHAELLTKQETNWKNRQAMNRTKQTKG